LAGVRSRVGATTRLKTRRRTAIDYAHMPRDLSDVHFAGAEKIVLVQDNLNTHAPASLYEAFPPGDARRLVERSTPSSTSAIANIRRAAFPSFVLLAAWRSCAGLSSGSG